MLSIHCLCSRVVCYMQTEPRRAPRPDRHVVRGRRRGLKGARPPVEDWPHQRYDAERAVVVMSSRVDYRGLRGLVIAL